MQDLCAECLVQCRLMPRHNVSIYRLRRAWPQWVPENSAASVSCLSPESNSGMSEYCGTIEYDAICMTGDDNTSNSDRTDGRTIVKS